LTRYDLLQALHGSYFEFLIRQVDTKSAALNELKDVYSKLVQDQDDLSKSEEKFRTLFDMLPDGILLIDPITHQTVDFNSVAAQQLGYTADEFLQLKISDYEVIETKEETDAHAKAIFSQGQHEFETVHRRKNGSLVNVSVIVSTVIIQDKNYFLAYYRDVTLQKENERRLLDDQEKFSNQSTFLHTLINTIPDLVWAKDTKGVYLACNETFERLYDAKESEIIGNDDFDFVNPELAQFFQDNDRAAIAAGGSKTNEEFLKFADGSHEGLFDTIKTPIKDSDGNILGVLGIAHDITERKQREEELYRKDADLSSAQALAHIGSWRFDISDDLLKWSDETYRIFGLEIGSPVSYESFLSFIHPDDRTIVERAWQKALVDKVTYEIEHRIVVKDEIKWVKEYAKIEADTSGQLLRGIGSVQDITERKLYEEKLQKLANYDTLTGLANRGLISSHLQNSIEKAKRHKTQIAVLMFDLDRFKDINDSFGHGAGDELLQQVAQRFDVRLRDGDIISRLGGDEFAIVLEHLNRPEDAGRIAKEMIDAQNAPYKLISGAVVHIGMSAGIVIFPDHGENASELLQHADAALYKAKSEGRGNYCYYTDELTDSARQRIEYETRLRRAVENNEFEVYYQPQVHIATGKIVGAEALVRWNDPEKGMIYPSLFIPIAEDTGLISAIGEWVLNETCRQGKIWLDGGHRLTLAVNLSAHQVRHQNIPAMVEAALKKSGYPADKLELELTESALMQREEETVAMLHMLRAQGIRLAIDDFGTGYSSLSYLKRFPIDVLKIDKSFVDDLPFDADDMAIVTAIIAMGTALGFQILAEGTERIEQIEFLKERGCTMYQGYYKSPPLPAKEFFELLCK
ncbi:EAL domain-containing protein, partial [bacterium]|nr:EAL domain-containing protein [bacterium]